MRRRAFLAAAAAAGAPVFVRGQTFPTQQARQLTVGVSVPLSGPRAQYGQEVVRGVQAAIDETNRFITPLQRAYGIRAFDDQNSGNIATTNVAIASADPSIVAMIGNLSADVTLQALPQYANANFALIVPTITADAITSRGFHNVFRLPTKDSTEGVLFARAVLQGRKRMPVVAITIDGDYGADVARGFIDQAKADKHDAQTTVLPDGFDPGTIVEKLRALAASYIFLCGKPDRLGPLAHGLRASGYKGEFGASDGFYTQTTIDKFAKPLDGALVASSLPPLGRIPSIFQYYNDFSRYVGAITAFSAYGYAAMQLLIAAAGRTSVPNRFGILNTLQNRGTYNTIVGPYSFNFSGDATFANIYLYAVASDGFKFAKPAIATGFVV
ncbi:MAG: branched-chain amino acid ABC transporter substrate-binding protein [Candidatus Eremiobacteraeota bacterium]|nr:branched-chain amino acid ABC transporter substrate-binding protein [Candidatus Eremiobacteraeota bacterium]